MRTLLVILVALLLAAPLAAQSTGPRGDSRPSGPTNGGAPGGPFLVDSNGRVTPAVHPIVNRVIDLLDDDVTLTPDDVTVWTSQSIDTSQFNRIGIRVSGEASPLVECRTEWQFGADDEFLPAGPYAVFGTGVRFGDFGRIEFDPGVRDDRQEYPDGDPSLRDEPIVPDVVLGPGHDFGEVVGTRARIVCTLPVTVVTIGDDPDIGLPDPDDPSSATLTDVKVLLRRL